MRTRLYQLQVSPGQPLVNTQAMLDAIDNARGDRIDLICFPEMAIPGYLIADEWERESFLAECEACTEAVVAAAVDIIVVFGNIALDRNKKNEDGRVRKYNAVFIAENRELIRHPVTGYPFFIKFLMPNYREFDDSRHFYDPRKLVDHQHLSPEQLIAPVVTSRGRFGCVLCEDGWDEDYNLSPLRQLVEQKVELLINISSSPYTYNKSQKRHRVFSAHARALATPIYYINCCGLQDNGKTLFTFDGATCGYDRNGELLGKAKAFKEDYCDFNHRTGRGQPNVPAQDTISTQFDALSFGIKTFMNRIGLQKVVVGVSGGVDSAVAAAIYRYLLPKDKLLLVSMPGPYSSETTQTLARSLATNLDCFFTELPITPSVEITRAQLQQARLTDAHGERISLAVTDSVLENIQARDRSSRVLAGIAAAFGGAFTCNANKSELTVGYSTLYGDLGGFLAALGDLWKTEIYELARFLNTEVYAREVIPQGTIDIVPSAELGPNHDVDSGLGDPLFYPYHDRLFQSWVEFWNRATPEDNLRWFIDGSLAARLQYPGDVTALFPDARAFIADLERWWHLYQGMAVAKRIQAPPVLALKRRAFGFDHREAQLGPRYTSGYLKLKAQALAR